MQRFMNANQISWNLNKVQSYYRNLILNDIGKDIKVKDREICLCGANSLDLIAKVDRFGLPFGSYICKKCGLILTSPYIEEESLAKYYSRYYHPLTFGKVKPENVGNLFSRGQGKKILRSLLPYINKNEISVFELGAAAGSNLIEFSKEAIAQGIKTRLFGLEFNELYVEYGKKQGISLSSLPLNEYVQKIKFKFDVVILSHVLEHFTDIRSNIECIKRISKDSTVIYIEVPGVLDLKQRYVYNCDFLKYITHAHVFNFSKSTLKNTLGLYGLNMLEGNEKIESIFIIDDYKRQDIKGGGENYNKIIFYLKDLESNLSYYQSKNPDNKLIHRLKDMAVKWLGGIRQ